MDDALHHLAQHLGSLEATQGWDRLPEIDEHAAEALLYALGHESRDDHAVTLASTVPTVWVHGDGVWAVHTSSGEPDPVDALDDDLLSVVRGSAAGSEEREAGYAALYHLVRCFPHLAGD